MTLRQLAWKNIRFRLRSLLGFALAATFGAWLFFLFASIRYNPVLGPMVATMSPGMGFLQLIVAAVVTVTALNALGASIRERGRELGLLQLQGMSWRHLGALLAWETFLIGYGSTGVGIGVGVLTGKLLFLVFSKAIRSSQPVAFTFESGAVLETLLLFGIVFAAAGLISARHLGRRSLADLLQTASRRDGAMTISRWQVVLCLLSYLGAGWIYFFANLSKESASESISAWFGILALFSLGTYTLYTQGGVALLRWLRGRPLYWRGTNLPVLAGLGHRLRSNARTLWTVTTLAALTIVAVGLTAGVALTMPAIIEEGLPVDLMLTNRPEGAIVVSKEQVRQTLTEASVRTLDEVSITLLAESGRIVGRLTEQQPGAPLAVIARSDFERWRRVEPTLPPLPADGLLLLAHGYTAPDQSPGPSPLSEEQRALLPAALRGEPAQVRVGTFLWGASGARVVAVVSDSAWAALAATWSREEVTGWRLDGWLGQADQTRSALAKLGLMPELHSLLLLSRAEGYWEEWADVGLSIFFFGFLSLLFFLSSGAILAFRLFADLPADKVIFRRLGEIGLSPADLKGMVNRQTAFLFLMPILLASLGGGALVVSAGAIMRVVTWQGALIAAVLYAALQLSYLAVAARAYRRAVSPY